MHHHASQASESLELAILLACSGGLMDAYSYLGRGHVFANAQTGNLLLLGISIMSGELDAVARYALPVLGFAFGCAASQEIRMRWPGAMHWRQVAIAIEAALLFAVSFMPTTTNLLANSLTSLACGMQVQAFRSLHGRPFATTMCIGNLRSGTQALVEFLHSRDGHELRSAVLYYFVIACFVAGAVLGSRLLGLWGLATIRVSCVMLAAAFIVMLDDREAAGTPDDPILVADED